MLVAGRTWLLILMPGRIDEDLSAQTEAGRIRFLKHPRVLWPHVTSDKKAFSCGSEVNPTLRPSGHWADVVERAEHGWTLEIQPFCSPEEQISSSEVLMPLNTGKTGQAKVAQGPAGWPQLREQSETLPSCGSSRLEQRGPPASSSKPILGSPSLSHLPPPSFPSWAPAEWRKIYVWI